MLSTLRFLSGTMIGSSIVFLIRGQNATAPLIGACFFLLVMGIIATHRLNKAGISTE